MSVTVFSDHDFRDMAVDVRPVPVGVQPRELKMHALPDSPYERTMYLDADTHVCGDITPVFDVLEKFDAAFAACLDKPPRPLDGVPDSYPELNGGVILYRKSIGTAELLMMLAENYRRLCERYGGLDEPSLRLAAWESSARIGILSPEYNLRVDEVAFVSGTVKVLHGKKVSEMLAEEINAVSTFRMYTPGVGMRTLL